MATMPVLPDRNLEFILATYRRELEIQPDFALEILIIHYELRCSDDRQSYINAIVEHFKQQLLKGEI